MRLFLKDDALLHKLIAIFLEILDMTVLTVLYFSSFVQIILFEKECARK